MSKAAGREALVERVFELREVMHQHFEHELDKELRDRLDHVTIHQLSVLAQLKEDARPMRELAKCLGISESAATATADRLVRQGLAERHSDPDDRRVVLLGLSKEGSRMATSLHRAATKKSERMLAVLSDAQLGQLVDILETLQAAWAAGETTTGPQDDRHDEAGATR